MRIMSSLVYDWLVSAGDDNLARKFKEEVSPESLPPNALRLADIVKIYQKENTTRKRKAGPLMSERDAKKARKEEVPVSKCVPAHVVAKPAAQKKKNCSEEDNRSNEEEEAQLGVEKAPMMLVAARRKDSSTDDGKIVIPDGENVKSIPDNVNIFEGEKEKPAVKQVQVVDLESSAESDDDSIVEEESPKPPHQNVQTVVLDSSSESDSSDDEGEMSKTEGAVSTNKATDIASPDAAKKVDGSSAAAEKAEKSKMHPVETIQQQAASGCRLFVHGVKKDINIVNLKSAFDEHGKVLDVYNSKKGFACVTFSKASEATAAIEAFDKQVVCGCSVEVSLSRPIGEEVILKKGKHDGHKGGKGRGEEGVQGARLYINNLSQEVTRENLHEKFSLHGNVVDTFYKPGRSYAFITFASAVEANSAIEAMNGKNMCGRAIQCSVAKPKENGGRGGGRRCGGGQGGLGARKSGLV